MQELVEAIRRGERDRLEELYTQNKGLLYLLSRRYRGACERDRAVSEEDLIQAGFLGLLAAVEAWEPERGAWATLAAMYVKKAMREALGIRSARIRAEHGALSLDAPLPGGEDSDTSFMDVLEDTDAPSSDDALLLQDLQRQVRAAVHELEDERARDVVWTSDIEGRTYQEISAGLGVSRERVRQIRVQGLRELRCSQRVCELARAYDLDQRTRFHAHKGVMAFRADWTSTTEAAALWRIEHSGRHGTS